VKYYLVAGEKSGDLHGGNLLKALKKEDVNATFRGFGGDEMKNQGMDIAVHFNELAFMGFISLLKNTFTIFKYIAFCKKDILNYQPDVIVLIDYGGFNRGMAKFGKKKGFKVYYYITPKVWAWYQKRALDFKRTVDRMFVILPFEKDFYKKFDWDVDYVGNPVLDAIKSFKANSDFTKQHQLENKDVIALLPGSRKMELIKLVPLMAEVVKMNQQFQFVVAAVKELNQELYNPFAEFKNVKLIYDSSYDILSIAKAAIVTSGTATLETGIFKVPQVVVYRMGALEYLIVKSLVKVPFISLVNLIADKQVVKELIQEMANTEQTHHELNALMNDASYRDSMLSEYDRIFKILDTGSASENTARLMVNYLKAENK
jgi:lipid-A-disaccharide synthase